MAGSIRSHKDLRVCQEAVALVKLTYELTRRLPARERLGLSPQMCRAAVSVPANIAEGHGSNHRRVFLNHLSISRGSLMELDTYVTLTVELGMLRPEQVAETQRKIQDVGHLLSALIRALRPKLPLPNP